jgi:hypothetical protein
LRVTEEDKQAELAACFMKVSCFANSLTLEGEMTCSSEMSDDFQWTTWHYIAGDGTLSD